ncbi:MAG: serine phosphatase RsbU [uncultured bacterium]|nr:MAG: serine phosphatase RsbU [uncultured bacterium]
MESYKRSFEELRSRFHLAQKASRNLTLIDPATAAIPVAYCTHSIAEMGGDFIGLVNVKNGCDILVADVAGHDMAAFMYTMLIKAFFEENSRKELPGETLLFLLNNAIQNASLDMVSDPRLVSAVFIHVDLQSKCANIVSAGHPPAVLIDRENNRLAPVFSQGSILGISPDTTYIPVKLDFKPGNRLLVYTDGLANACRIDGPTGKELRLSPAGIDQLIMEFFRTDLKSMTDSIWQGVLDFCHNKLDDDTSLLTIEFPEGKQNV